MLERRTSDRSCILPIACSGFCCAGSGLTGPSRFCRETGNRRRVATASISTVRIRSLILLTKNENFSWGAPPIHGELLKLGIEGSERTVSRYLACLPRNGNAGQRWRTFLKNHREDITEMDFFTVVTANFRILYCFFLIGHGRL